MFRKPLPADWMWSEALELVERAERMQRQFFRLAGSPRGVATWEPPADVFEDETGLLVVVALPGVAAEDVEIDAEPGALVVRAYRPQPLAGARHVVRRLEIPYGRFERRIALPAGRFEALAHEVANGCLVLRLRRIG